MTAAQKGSGGSFNPFQNKQKEARCTLQACVELY